MCYKTRVTFGNFICLFSVNRYCFSPEGLKKMQISTFETFLKFCTILYCNYLIIEIATMVNYQTLSLSSVSYKFVSVKCCKNHKAWLFTTAYYLLEILVKGPSS